MTRPTIGQRWEQGIPHDPRTVELFKHIAKIDFEECKDYFCFKSGGDGDNGEHLMYLIDDFFFEQDRKLAETQCSYAGYVSRVRCTHKRHDNNTPHSFQAADGSGEVGMHMRFFDNPDEVK